MAVFKVTILAACLVAVSCEPPVPSTSYGVPAVDSYSPSYGGDRGFTGGHGAHGGYGGSHGGYGGGHGGHETVKRHIKHGYSSSQQDCCGGGNGYGASPSRGEGTSSVGHPTNYERTDSCCSTGGTEGHQLSGGGDRGYYNGGSASVNTGIVHPGYGNGKPSSQSDCRGGCEYGQLGPTREAHPVYGAGRASEGNPSYGGGGQQVPSSNCYGECGGKEPSPPSEVQHGYGYTVPETPNIHQTPLTSSPSTVGSGGGTHDFSRWDGGGGPDHGGRPNYSGGYNGGRPNYDVHPGGYGGWGLSTKPYQFGYSVRDQYTGADFKQQETSDGNTVKGQYKVALPDGRIQIVTYTADWQTGFHADVQYEGEASYPAVYGTGGTFQSGGGYGAPAHGGGYAPSGQPSSGYGAPAHGGFQHQGGSYQPQGGIGGTGSQYNHIGHSGGSSYASPPSSSYGHPSGYRK